MSSVWCAAHDLIEKWSDTRVTSERVMNRPRCEVMVFVVMVPGWRQGEVETDKQRL